MVKEMNKIITLLAVAITLLFTSSISMATEDIKVGTPAYDYQTHFQPAATPIMEELLSFHEKLLYVIFGVSIFVALLLLYTCLRFSEKANPKPSKTSHNTTIEVIWTVIPILILVYLWIPSSHVLYEMDKVQDSDMTIKVVGHQWYWSYEYPDSEIEFDSRMIEDKDIKEDEGQLRLLETDTQIVVPVNTKVRVQVTASDVIHAWAVPAFGIKIDAIPGRLNEVWFKATEIGTYYGQCSELCGRDHGFMPIMVKVVSQQDYEQWITDVKSGRLDDYASFIQNDIRQIASLNEQN